MEERDLALQELGQWGEWAGELGVAAPDFREVIQTVPMMTGPFRQVCQSAGCCEAPLETWVLQVDSGMVDDWPGLKVIAVGHLQWECLPGLG